MRLRVEHSTRYEYGCPVSLEPHIIRLRPRDDGSLRLLEYSLSIQPRPSTLAACLDEEGNHAMNAWFDERTGRLTVRAVFVVEMLRENPFDFLLTDPSAATLPLFYADELRGRLAPYCVASKPHRLVYEFARDVAEEVDWQTLPFLGSLSRRIHDSIEHVVREEGEPLPAEQTLLGRTGACRDAAVLFVTACRSMGVASRFVSGYEVIAAQQEKTYMHAWAEAFLPGGGWRGYDPSRGLAVAQYHVPVAAAVQPSGATPISGTFRGTGVSSRMDFEIAMDELP